MTNIEEFYHLASRCDLGATSGKIY